MYSMYVVNTHIKVEFDIWHFQWYVSPAGTIEQNLPQPFLIVLFGLSGRSRGPRGQHPLVRELSHNIRLS